MLLLLKVLEFLNSANPNGSITVFADTFTGVDNRTHYVVINGSSLEEAMSNLDSSLATAEGQNFQRRANKFRKVKHLFSVLSKELGKIN